MGNSGRKHLLRVGDTVYLEAVDKYAVQPRECLEHVIVKADSENAYVVYEHDMQRYTETENELLLTKIDQKTKKAVSNVIGKEVVTWIVWFNLDEFSADATGEYKKALGTR